MTEQRARQEPPSGLRWATGGGSPVGDCNGYHLAPVDRSGTLCGRYAPYTLPAPSLNASVCGSCERLLVSRTARAGAC